ncbi:DNA polymerase IV [Gabonibacter chumensis]|uniref:DNA polymerase IV n=1 Tax=Gabonibacter chumensis TaxID=2972474 RepID=UPI00257442D5|nr:DNA polymerase IV [Gabonibacter chumensis]MCR9011267.1 DNA polymerase IV [Gabonibacter chumensis]
MYNRKIIHIDMDAFYASIEQRDHPEYRGKPVVVGRPEARGVIAAASYEARRYGIHSAMSSMKALKLCPDLIFISSRMEVYKAVSREIHQIFRKYTDLIEPLSIDEAFLDVTENKKGIFLAVDIAKAIKKEIKEKLGLIASAGISYNKFLAKIASDYRKPDGLYTIHPDRALSFIAKLPIEAFWGIGKVTARKMHELGVHTGQDLQYCSPEFLTRNFGKAGTLYYDFAHGIDSRPVEPLRIRKSVGCEQTYDKDLTTHTALIIELYHITKELIRRLKKNNFKGHTLTLKVKFHDFTQKTRSISLSNELTTLQEILPLAKNLLNELKLEDYRIRLLGLSVSNPFDGSSPHQPTQLSFNFK